jgi:hypothetical protein
MVIVLILFLGTTNFNTLPKEYFIDYINKFCLLNELDSKFKP